MENEALIADLLEWIAPEPKPYTEVMAAWRTTCPRLTVWEDTTDARFVRLERTETSQIVVSITERGRQFLQAQRSHNEAQRRGSQKPPKEL